MTKPSEVVTTLATRYAHSINQTEKVSNNGYLLSSWHDTQHEKSMTLIRQENNDLSTSISKI